MHHKPRRKAGLARDVVDRVKFADSNRVAPIENAPIVRWAKARLAESKYKTSGSDPFD